MSKRAHPHACPFRGVIDVRSCPVFQGRCPFSNAGANNAMIDDITGVLAFMPRSHTDETAEDALPAECLMAVKSLQKKIESMIPPVRYITKTTKGDFMVDRMRELANHRDLRVASAAVRLSHGGPKTSALFASDIIACNCVEKDCVDYIVGLYRVYSALEDAWVVTGEGRVRTLHKPYLSRKNLLRNELAYFFCIDAASVNDHIEENFPPSVVLRDSIKRIKHVMVVNPILLIAHMYAMYAGILLARDFRKGLRLCAPNLSRICVFRDLDIDPCPIEYQKSLDSLGLSPEEADEIIFELKHLYAAQAALFHELDVKRGKVAPSLVSTSERTVARVMRAAAQPNSPPPRPAPFEDVRHLRRAEESWVRSEADHGRERSAAVLLHSLRLLRQELRTPLSNTLPQGTQQANTMSTTSKLLHSVLQPIAVIIIAMLAFFVLSTTGATGAGNASRGH